MEVSITGSTVRVYFSHLEASQLGNEAVREAVGNNILGELSEHVRAEAAGEETPTAKRARERQEARDAREEAAAEAAKPKAK